jgi:hypothetical protein
MCRFYVAVAVEMLRQFGIPAHGGVDACRAVGAPTCVLTFDLTQASAPPAVAA